MKVETEKGGHHVKLEAQDKLLPCPFCGSEDLELNNTHTACYWVECSQCGAEVSGTAIYSDSDKPEDHLEAAKSAISAWNRRQPQKMG